MRLAFLVLIAFTASAQDPSKGVNFYSLEKERALGEQLAKEVRWSNTPVDDPAILAWINDLAKRLLPDSRLSYTFELIKEDPTMLHEPLSLPGGFVFVPVQLILAAQSEDEFAGMLAHAMAHVEARHGARQATQGQTANFATIPLIFMGGWTGFAVGRNGTMAIPRGFVDAHRAFELDADRIAAEKMSASGYDPEALARYIEREQPPDPPQPKPHSPMPERAARVAAVRAMSTGRAYPPHPDFPGLQDELRRRLAR
jgi:beta-barrel assembly-enhancing protease